ncbi:hypothetical protein HDU67_002453, partial [Dinochytrium kinnereticum]
MTASRSSSCMRLMSLLVLLLAALMAEPVAAQSRCECYCSGQYVGNTGLGCSYNTYFNLPICNPPIRVTSRFYSNYYNRSYLSIGSIIGAAIGGLVFLVLVIVLVVYFCRYRGRNVDAFDAPYS